MRINSFKFGRGFEGKFVIYYPIEIQGITDRIEFNLNQLRRLGVLQILGGERMSHESTETFQFTRNNR
jgi:chromosome condensin MukBEF MukE localization factor